MSFTRAQLLGIARKSGIDCSQDEVITEQSHKESCDIHTIMRKYERTGMLEHTNAYQGRYMDMPSGLDFQTAQNIIAEAKSVFETVPSKIRADFDHDPAKFLDFMQDPANKEQIASYGFDASYLPDPEPIAPQEVPSAPSEG